MAHDFLYKPEPVSEEEKAQSPWAKLIESAKKLQVLFARSSGLTDLDVGQMCEVIKTNTTIKILDISSNRSINSAALTGFQEVLQENRTLEYLGFAKLGLKNEDIKPLFD